MIFKSEVLCFLWHIILYGSIFSLDTFWSLLCLFNTFCEYRSWISHNHFLTMLATILINWGYCQVLACEAGSQFDWYVISINMSYISFSLIPMCFVGPESKCPLLPNAPNSQLMLVAGQGKRLRATSHTSQNPWWWNCESSKECVQRPSQDTLKIINCGHDPQV